MNLAMLRPGQRGKITTIGAIGPMKRRLMDMGVLKGVEVKVEKIAPRYKAPFLLYAFLTFTGAQASMWPDVASIQPIL